MVSQTEFRNPALTMCLLALPHQSIVKGTWNVTQDQTYLTKLHPLSPSRLGFNFRISPISEWASTAT